MRFLFVHQNFPAQYRHLALHLAALGHEVAAIGEKANALRQRTRVPGIRLLGYEAFTELKQMDAWYHWRAGIGAEGQWQYFVAGD